MFEFPQSLNFTTLLYMAVASFLGWIGGWLRGRQRDRAEVDKLQAEAKSIHITAENSQVGVGLETLREIQLVIDKAEKRREEWQAKEDQMRGQIIHWRNKAEELDGELIDSRQARTLMDSRLKLNEIQIKKLKALLDYHNISYAELDQSKK